MKKFIFTIATFFLFSTTIFAQTSSENQIEWKLLAPENEEFSVDAPNDIAAFSYDAENEIRRYSGVSDGTYFFIFSDKQKSVFQPVTQYDTVLKFVGIYRKSELEAQKKSNEMKFSFTDDENFFHTVYVVKTKKRSYIFHLFSEKNDDPNVKRFFKSLKVGNKSAGTESEDTVEKTSVDEAEKTAEIPTENKNSEQQKTVSGTGSGEGNGSGNGRGSGVGNGTGNNLPNNNENKTLESKELSITFKPKPKYTDFARFYGIVGNVRVKTTFLSNGTIGTTIPLTKLPFGLTQAAIETVKQVRFDAKTVNGKPVSVTKVIVFNFTVF